MMREISKPQVDFAALESIDVRGNNVEWFPLEVLGLGSLRSLDLSQNSMTELPLEILQGEKRMGWWLVGSHNSL